MLNQDSMFVNDDNPPFHDYRLKFGKHQGQMLKDVPVDYLEWLFDNPETKPILRAVISRFLGMDPIENDTEPDPTSAAVALPGIISRWHRVMSEEFANDPHAVIIVERGLVELKTQCSEFTGKSWQEEAIPTPCKYCQAEEILVLRWQEFANKSRHIRGECRSCGKFLAYVPQSKAEIAEANRVEGEAK